MASIRARIAVIAVMCLCGLYFSNNFANSTTTFNSIIMLKFSLMNNPYDHQNNVTTTTTRIRRKTRLRAHLAPRKQGIPTHGLTSAPLLPEHAFTPHAVFNDDDDDLTQAGDDNSTRTNRTTVPRCRISYHQGNRRVRRTDLVASATPQWSFRREVTCDSDQRTGAGINKEKGRALVIYMVSGEWNSSHPNRGQEQLNFDFFVHFGYLRPSISTKLFSGVDYVIHRRANVTGTVEMPYADCGWDKAGMKNAGEGRSGINDNTTFDSNSSTKKSAIEDNVRIIYVPISIRCDLCGHGLVLQYLNYKERAENGTWPYKSVIVLNSGTRGPFLSDEEHLKAISKIRRGEREISTWLDVVSIGEGERPLYRADDLGEHWTTITGSNLNHHFGHPHLQSTFLVIPISSMPFYYTLLLQGGCYDSLPIHGENNTKHQCIYMCELMQSNFLDPNRNGLTPPNPGRVRTLGIYRDPYKERLTRADGGIFTLEDEHSRYRFWQLGMGRKRPGGFYHLGMNNNKNISVPFWPYPIYGNFDEIYNGVVFKFGGQLLAMYSKKRISQINSHTRMRMRLQSNPKSEALKKLLSSVKPKQRLQQHTIEQQEALNTNGSGGVDSSKSHADDDQHQISEEPFLCHLWEFELLREHE